MIDLVSTSLRAAISPPLGGDGGPGVEVGLYVGNIGASLGGDEQRRVRDW